MERVDVDRTGPIGAIVSAEQAVDGWDQPESGIPGRLTSSLGSASNCTVGDSVWANSFHQQPPPPLHQQQQPPPHNHDQIRTALDMDAGFGDHRFLCTMVRSLELLGDSKGSLAARAVPSAKTPDASSPGAGRLSAHRGPPVTRGQCGQMEILHVPYFGTRVL